MASPRVSAIVGVKDEAHLIEPCVRNLQRLGVCGIVVLDDHSTDGTAEIVDRIAAQSGSGVTRILCGGEDYAAHLSRRGPVIAPLLAANAPDWITFIDADEFIVSACPLPTLAATLSVDAIALERYNTPPIADVAALEDPGGLPLLVEKTNLDRAALQTMGVRWLTHAIVPKLMCRVEKFREFLPGSHEALGLDGEHLTPSRSASALIAHVPFSNLARFELKVANARAFLARSAKHYRGNAAWHWRHWIEIADRGELAQEFERQGFGAEALALLRRNGGLKTARELLAQAAPVAA
jgi:glycosyltransferase involved in cell wall biosynthesis